jgi:cytolysin-activating lysine-acyltransferase
MQQGHRLSFIAPSLNGASYNPAEILGAMTWLWLHAPGHRDLPVQALARFALPPITRGQFILVTEQQPGATVPVAYATWALLDAGAESRYIADPAHGLQPEDWACGDRPWMIDWFAPFGHSRALVGHARTVFQGMSVRGLYHRGAERGFRVKTFQGAGVDRAVALAWWRARPMLAVPSGRRVARPRHEGNVTDTREEQP